MSSIYKIELALSFCPEGQSSGQRLRKKVAKLKPYSAGFAGQAVSGKCSPPSLGVSGYPHVVELSNPYSDQKGW